MDQDQDDRGRFLMLDPLPLEDEREAASLERSARLLEPPSPEEIAEQAERARRNRMNQIM